MSGTYEIVPLETLWSIWGSHQTLWSLPSPKCYIKFYGIQWHPPLIRHFNKFWPCYRTGPFYLLWLYYQFSGGFNYHLQRPVNRGCLILRTPGPVPFGTCICSNVEIIHSWTCHVSRLFIPLANKVWGWVYRNHRVWQFILSYMSIWIVICFCGYALFTWMWQSLYYIYN